MRALPALLLLPLLAACGGPEVLEVSVEPSPDVATVLEVHWTADGPVAGELLYGTDGALDRSLAFEQEAEEHEGLLLGLPAETTVSWELRLADGDDWIEAASGEAQTGSLPVDLPSLSVQGDGNDRYLVTTLLGGVTSPVILDPQGRITWYHLDEHELDTYRARLSRDGRWLYYNAASVSGDPAEDSVLVRVSLDGSTVEEIPVPLLAHDFVELPDGTLAAIQVQYREQDGEEIRGDGIVLVDPETGDVTPFWSAWDCFDPSTDVGDSVEQGWTFANALDYDEEDDAFLLSIRNFSSIVKIDRATGDCLWGFGGVANDFDFAQGSATFMHEHQFEIQDGRALVFDNDGASGNVSRVLEYRFDEEGRSAEQVWSYQADPPVYSFVLGDVARFEDGSTLVTWSMGGQVDRVDAGGQLLWRLNTDLGYALGFDVPIHQDELGRAWR